VDFFYTNSLDSTYIGYTNVAAFAKYSAKCGLPMTYSAKCAQDLHRILPNGVNFLSRHISWDDLKKNDRNIEEILLWPENVKMYAAARELVGMNRPTVVYRALFDMLLSNLVTFGFSTNMRKKKPFLIFKSKLWTYVTTAYFALAAVIFHRIFDKSMEDRYKDQKACALGLDMCEASIDYYRKIKERNLAFREILADGAYLIDENGNLKYFVYKIPYFERYIEIRNNNESLASKEELCRKKLVSTIEDFEKKNDQIQLKTNVSSKNSDKSFKELEFLKKIRLSIQNSKEQKTKTNDP
jgi:hypothetical protein